MTKNNDLINSHNFRIDRHPDEEKKLTDEDFNSQMGAFFMTYMYNISTHVVVMKEYGDDTGKLHFHCNVVYKKPMPYITIKKRWDAAFPKHSGGSKSMAKPKKKTNLSYICKDNCPVFFKGYTKEEIATIGSQWIHKKPELKVNAVMTVTATLKEKYSDEIPWNFTEIIIDEVLKYFKARGTAIQRFMLYAIIDGVRLQFSDINDEDDFRSEIHSGYQNYSMK